MTTKTPFSPDENRSYEKYKQNRIWKKVEKSLKDLALNKAIILTIPPEEVIGYIIKNIIEEDSAEK